MPKSTIVGTGLEWALDLLEDYTLDTRLLRSQNYHIIQNTLDSNGSVNIHEIKRLLAICEHDLKEDKKHAVNALNIISAILKKIKAGEYTPIPDLVPSMLAVINLIKTIARMSKLESLQLLCFEILLTYPEDILAAVINNNSTEVLEIFNLYFHPAIPETVKFQPLNIISRLLKILPPNLKKEFVGGGLSIWFSKLLPITVSQIACSTSTSLLLFEVLESLTDELVAIDYTENMEWQQLLVSMYNPNSYSLVMKNMLENANENWHRLWIIFVRLLKHQITVTKKGACSPINCMLPVVEKAFKMDITNRCRAFHCWKVLIDSLSSDKNDAFVNKGIKLLMVPLKLNNAKVEATIVAKFEAWWNLIVRFQFKMDKLAETTLIPFLHFCFGKQISTGRASTGHGCTSVTVMKQCVQALAEILGHSNCDCCVSIPRLHGKLINTQLLAYHWKDWVHSLKTAHKAIVDSELTLKDNILCMWISFVLTISELPDNNIRKDLVDELVEAMGQLVQDSQNCNKKGGVMFDVLTKTFLLEDTAKLLFKANNENVCSVNKVICLIMNPALHQFYQSCTTEDIVTQLRPFTDLIIKEQVRTSGHILEQIFEDLSAKDVSLLFWTALAQSINESKHNICIKGLQNILLYPLKFTNSSTNVECCGAEWYKMYNIEYLKLCQTSFDKAVLNILSVKNFNSSTIHLDLCVLLALLKHGLIKNNNTESEKEAELLFKALGNVKDYRSIMNNFPVLVDSLVLLMNRVTEFVNIILAKLSLSSIKLALKLLIHALKSQSYDENVFIFFESLLKPLEVLLKTEVYADLELIIIDELIECSTLFNQKSSLNSIIISLLKAFLPRSKDNTLLHTKVKSAISEIENKKSSIVHDSTIQDVNNFSVPDSKEKKTKKKLASIVNTVSENGEEYVVVKSNWKFNPKKLTDKQKEKLQRKREDIPALYQDLSQSQEEFKLVSWKTDSQDTSTSKSVSKSDNENVSSILQRIPNSEVVPKIMENILSENAKKGIENDKDKSDNDESNTLKQTPPTKANKSSHMALKDRVFRNVRNLIEKSTMQRQEKHLSDSLNQTIIDNVPETPQNANMSSNLANSASSKVSSERPSRVKRPPKKFEDSEIFLLKKRRLSLSQSDSQKDCEITDPLNMSTQINKSTADVDGIARDAGNKIHSIETVITAEEKKNTESLPSKESDDSEKQDTLRLLAEDNNALISCEYTNIDLNVINCETSKGNNCKLQVVDDESMPKEVNTNELKPTVSDVNTNDTAIISSAVQDMSNRTIDIKEKQPSTPKCTIKKKDLDQTSTLKKKSRIEKELAIDMVEGHPFLKGSQSEKRITRKFIKSSLNSTRRKSLTDKLNKIKVEDKHNIIKLDKKSKRSLNDPQTNTSQDFPSSEDVIESSQDSTITTISAISIKNKQPVVVLKHYKQTKNKNTQKMLEDDSEDFQSSNNSSPKHESKNDIELPQNKTVEDHPVIINTTENMDTKSLEDFKDNINLTESVDVEPINAKKIIEEKTDLELTENLDTEPIDKEQYNHSCDIIINNNDSEQPITIDPDVLKIESDTQDTANADTQPTDTLVLTENEESIQISDDTECKSIVLNNEILNKESLEVIEINSVTPTETQDDALKLDSNVMSSKSQNELNNTVSSPLKDENERKKNFLSDTLEISPIKILSPIKDKKTSSPENSNDFVVIKLSSPVQSNGEPFEKCNSPEIFTEEKISPDKRDQSPPRVEMNVNSTSCSSPLSLKKNRPQMRSGGRAAQMLGLCVPDRLQTIISSEKFTESDEQKKLTSVPIAARRNLRILYNSVGDGHNDNSDENENSENFLKFKKSLPSADCSPSGPILKRKLADIIDEATISPASKRKRVSFHDPPVSTTVVVHKYIEPSGVRSPSNSALKRQERQNRSQTNAKSVKRLDNVFNLESVLTKTVESFNDMESSVDDIEMSSLDQTPAVEIIKVSELNDVDPICPELLHCKDPIDNIAMELSSPAMKSLLVKELEGKIETVGDLAKMTELEVNRLCIKAPKVKVAKKVLIDYSSKITSMAQNEQNKENIEIPLIEHANGSKQKNTETGSDVGVQTEGVLTESAAIQTDTSQMTFVETQTDNLLVCHSSSQTDESGIKSTADIIKSCLTDRPDFIENLNQQLDVALKRTIAESLPFDFLLSILTTKAENSHCSNILKTAIEFQNNMETLSEQNENSELLFLQKYLYEKFDLKQLILLFNQLLLKKIE